MDPVGSWSAYAASYNRLAGATGSSGDYPHHLAATNAGPSPSTTSPLLLQAAHATSSSAFTPGSFLSPPPPVGYDPVFSPFLHHANQKAHYTQALNAAQHRQVISSPKPGSMESDSLRENYTPVHPQPLPPPNPAFFEQASGSVQPSTIAWTHQGNSHSQLPSPFGILPHESVVGSSPTGSTTKIPYENFNPAHFAAAQTLNHINSQLAAVSYSDASKRLTSRPLQSPPSKNSTPNVTSSGYYQQSSPSSSNQFLVTKTQTSTSKVYSGVTGSGQPTQAHNVMSTPTTNSSKDYNLSLPQVHPSSAAFSSRIPEKQSGEFQSPTAKSNPTVPGKIAERRDSGHEPTQSSPISFAVMDSTQNRSTSKVPSTRTGIPQQSQLQQQLLSHQKTGSYRGFSSSTGSTPESEYNPGSGGRNTASTDAGYSSGSSVGHSGVDASLQRSPLDSHVTSPTAYPVYHSPMTSMSSPSPVQQHVDQNGSYKQNPSPQVTATSPLDASLTRHPSVITRGDTNYPNDTFPQKQCWDGAEQLRNQKYSSYSSEVPQNTNNMPMPHQITVPLAADRHQGYLESTNQSLSSVKGDPMTIVKNLQNLQQQCQAPTLSAAIKSDFDNPKHVLKNSGSSGKRKKSIDSKAPVTHPDSQSKVPPPAHLNQPLQGGGYAEYEKWNVQHSQNGNPAFTPQNTPPPNANPMNQAYASHSHHQATGSTHYFPSHMPNSQDQKYPNPSMPKNSAATVDPARYSVDVTVPKVEDIPVAKVIVPDVEEELGFLAEMPKTDSKSNDKIGISNTPVIKLCPNPKTSFMESYIKFIQGEKESSPPPRRKPLKPTYIPINKRTQPVKSETKKPRKKPEYSPPEETDPTLEDDPRYFPLPKDPSSRKLNSSESEETDYDNLIPTITHRPRSNSASVEATDNQESKKRRESIRRRGKAKRQRQSKKRKRSSSEESQELPRRRTSKRKAKEKISSFEDKTDDLFSGVSGSDVWSPDEESDDDDEYGKAFGSGRRKKSKGPAPSRFLESSDEEKKPKPKAAVVDVAGICPVCDSNFADDPADAVKCTSCKNQFHCSCCSLQTLQRLQKMGSKRGSWRCDNCKSAPAKRVQRTSSRKNGQSRKGRRTKFNSQVQEDEFETNLGTEEYFPFKSGEFIVVKDELVEEHPPIWRVDGKTLLQKYEPFDQNGEKLYRNISTYSGWTPQNRDIYQKIPVQFIVQSRMETIVRFLRSEMVDPAIEQAYLEQSLMETAKYQDNFEIYIQTLISQALDANFLAEIFSEKDEYFLQNVEVIDRVTEERRVRLVAAVDWPVDTSLQRGVTTWPCYNVLADLKAGPARLCDACEHSKVHARILLYGQPYNPNTLDGSTPDIRVKDDKDFMICLECIKYVQLYNKLVHQKYIMYIECAKRVQEKRKSDPQKDTTVILNELLADEEWLNKVFRQVRTVWADVEKAEREKQKKLGLSIKPPRSALVEPPEENISGDKNVVEQRNDEDDVIVEKELLVNEIKVERDSDAEEGNAVAVEDNDDINDVIVTVEEEGSAQPPPEQVEEEEEVTIERVPCES